MGQLTKVVFGLNVLSWNYSNFGGVTAVMLDGVLPVMGALARPTGRGGDAPLVLKHGGFLG